MAKNSGDEWEALNWTSFRHISDNPTEIPASAGVYAVRSIRGGRPRWIGRAFGKDESGIPCFGTTKKKTLRERVRQFCQAASCRPVSHAEGKTYCRAEYAKNGYSLNSLEIAWLCLSTQKQAIERERTWFQDDEKQFGELPPLNKQCG